MHEAQGPSSAGARSARPTSLPSSSDATRVVPFAAFATAENIHCLPARCSRESRLISPTGCPSASTSDEWRKPNREFPSARPDLRKARRNALVHARASGSAAGIGQDRALLQDAAPRRLAQPASSIPLTSHPGQPAARPQPQSASGPGSRAEYRQLPHRGIEGRTPLRAMGPLASAFCPLPRCHPRPSTRSFLFEARRLYRPPNGSHRGAGVCGDLTQCGRRPAHLGRRAALPGAARERPSAQSRAGLGFPARGARRGGRGGRTPLGRTVAALQEPGWTAPSR